MLRQVLWRHSDVCWRDCYHGDVCSLKQPDPAQRARFPHFGSKFRFSGRTQHQAGGTEEGPERIVPKINRKASTRFIGAKEQGYNVGSEYCHCHLSTRRFCFHHC